MTREDVRNIVVGVVTLAALFALGSLTFGGKSLEAAATGYVIRASFGKIDGLNVGDSVRLSGIKIGEVSGVRLGANYAAVVDLRIDSPIELPTDTSAAVHTDSLFGSKHVVLVPGAEDRLVKPGGMISLTQDSVMVSDLLDLISGEGRSKLAKKPAQEPAGQGANQGAAPLPGQGEPGSLMAPLLNDPAQTR